MKKRLTKSVNNRMLTGTLGGIAEYFGIDPTIVRVIYLFVSIALVGAPIFLYILLALAIPKANTGNPAYAGTDRPSKRQKKKAETTDEDEWNDF